MVTSVDLYRCATHPAPLSDAECRHLIALKSAEEADVFVRAHSKPVISTDHTDLSKMREVTIPSFFRPATGTMIYDTRAVEAHFSRRETDEDEILLAGLVKDIDVMIFGGFTAVAAEAMTALEISSFANIAKIITLISSAALEAGSAAEAVAGAIAAGAIVEAQAEPLALQARVLQAVQEAPAEPRAAIHAFVPQKGHGNVSPRHPFDTPEGRKEELERRFGGIAHDAGLARNAGEFTRFMTRNYAGTRDREPLSVVIVEGPYGQNGLPAREIRYVRGLPQRLVLPGERVVSVAIIREASPGVARIELPESMFGMRIQMPLVKALREMGALNTVVNPKTCAAEFLYPVPVRTAGNLTSILSSSGRPMRYVVVRTYKDGVARTEMFVGITPRKGDAGLLHSLMFSPETGASLVAAGEIRSENGRILMNGLSPEYPTAKRAVLGEYYEEDLAPKGQRGLEPALNMLNDGPMRSNHVQRDPSWNL